jgi:hypothetical protein
MMRAGSHGRVLFPSDPRCPRILDHNFWCVAPQRGRVAVEADLQRFLRCDVVEDFSLYNQIGYKG